MSLFINILNFVLPEAGAIVKLILTNPTKYAAFKTTFAELATVAQTIATDLAQVNSQL